MHRLDCKCETCYDDLEATNEKIAADNAYLIRIMQDIRNATDSQQQQSLLDLREELEQYRWVPVSERLPEENGYYQVIRKGNPWPTTRRFDTDYRWVSEDTVTHWKEVILPK